MIDVDYNEYKKTLARNMELIVENNRLKQVEIEHRRRNGELREENNRLDNIINELEKWLKGGGVIQFDLEHQMLAVKDILNKLQELKGSDKK